MLPELLLGIPNTNRTVSRPLASFTAGGASSIAADSLLQTGNSASSSPSFFPLNPSPTFLTTHVISTTSGGSSLPAVCPGRGPSNLVVTSALLAFLFYLQQYTQQPNNNNQIIIRNPISANIIIEVNPQSLSSQFPDPQLEPVFLDAG